MPKKDKSKLSKRERTKIKNKNKNKNTIVVNVNSHNKRKTTTQNKTDKNIPYHVPSMPYVINAPSAPQTQPVIIYQPNPVNTLMPLGQVNPISNPSTGQRSNLLYQPPRLETEIQTEDVLIETPENMTSFYNNANKLKSDLLTLNDKLNEMKEEKVYYKNKLIDLENENSILKKNEKKINEMYENVMSGGYTAELFKGDISKFKDTDNSNTPFKSRQNRSKNVPSSDKTVSKQRKNIYETQSFDNTTPKSQIYISPPSETSTPIGNNFLNTDAVNFTENIMSNEPINENQDSTQSLTQQNQSQESINKTFEDMTEEEKISALLDNTNYLEKYQDEYVARPNKEGKLRLYYQSGRPIIISRINNLFKKYIKQT